MIVSGYPMNYLEILQNHWMAWPIVGFVGLCFGSLISLLSYRLPLDLPVMATRSRCPHCQTALKPRDLIPILSFIMAQGVCRYCKTKLSARYLLSELVTAATFLGLYAMWGLSLEWVCLCLLAVGVITLTITDLEHYLIPDELQLLMLGAGVWWIFLRSASFDNHLMAAASGILTGAALVYGFRWLRHKEGLGWGDVKLMGVAGLWLGLEPMVPFFFYAGVLGIVLAMLWRALGRGEYFPFGPALALSMLMGVVFPSAFSQFWVLFSL